MQVAIVDYGSGNLRSAEKALERAASDRGLAVRIRVTSSPEVVVGADRIVLPGVGAFRDCCNGLKSVDGMWSALEEGVLKKATPFLGICVGMQLLATKGLEFGETEGLGWVEGTVKRIEPVSPKFKIPHMGWNSLEPAKSHSLLAGANYGEAGAHAYFVHSYKFVVDDEQDVLATTDYGTRLTAAVVRDNIAGTQFHPEKSHTFGLNLLGNFLEWRP